MSVTLDKLLSLPIFKEAKFITSIEKQRSFLVNSISVMEYPIDDFVRENEIVLSTCISCEDETIFEEFILDMVKMNATALVLAVGYYINDVPKNIIELAESSNLAIITIPWELRFSEVVENTYKLLDEQNNKEIKKFHLIKDRLISKFLEKDSLNDALKYLEKKMNFIFILENVDKTLIASSNHKNNNKLNNAENFYTFNIKHNGIHFANLKLIDTYDIINKSNSSFYYELIENNIINPLLLWFERTQAIYELEIHHKEKFILDLVDNKNENFDDVILEAKAYGFNLNKSYVAIVGKSDISLETRSTQQWLKTIKDTAIRIAKSKRRDCLIAYRNTFLIILLEQANESIEETKDYIRNLELSIKHIKLDIDFTWGIGGIYNDFNSIHNSYVDAIMSLKHGLSYNGTHINTPNTTREFKLLTELIKNEEVTTITKNILTDLANDKNSDLIETANRYFWNNRNVSRTAKEMFLHRQSLNYRLKKIEEITNLSLDNPNESFLLELSLRIYYFKNLTEI